MFYNNISTKLDTIKKEKRVQFNDNKYIHMYPNINHKELWWTRLDYSIFQNIANKEICMLMSIHPYMTPQQARQLLYQPNNISYNRNNFEHNIFM
jgi:hypothetical protein